MTKQQIKESLNKFDHQALDDCTKYYDLVNLYESAKFDMKDDDFKKLESLIKQSNVDEINTFMLHVLKEDFVYNEVGEKDTSDLNLNNILKEELMQEDKIVPEKCYAKESGKPYYSLKNVTDDEYIQYGARTRYNSKERAAEKLRDLKAHVDGEYIDSSNIIKSDNKTDESLEQSLVENTNASDYEDLIVFNDITLEDNEENANIIEFIKNPLKKHGTELQEQAKPLVLLYQHVYKEGLKKVPVEQLLKEAGVPNPERENTANTWFMEYKLLKLAEKHSNMVYPGLNLKYWVEGAGEIIGTRHFRDGHTEEIGTGTGLTDLRPYIKDIYTERPSQGIQPDRSHGKGDAKVISRDADMDDEDLPFKEVDKPIDVTPKNKYVVDLDFFESLEKNDLQEATDNLNKELIDLQRKTYREYANLKEDTDITEDNLQDWTYKHMCALHGWPFEETKKHLLGEN